MSETIETDTESAGWDEPALVGRLRPVTQLLARLDDARAGRGGLVVVAGDAGIGKTRVLLDFLRRASVGGPPPVLARCVEGEGTPPFWPWVQVLRSCRAEAEDLWAEQASQLDRLTPEAVAKSSGVTPMSGETGEGHRFVFYDAVARFLTRLSERAPRTLAVDDLHWADAGSVELLQFLGAQLDTNRLLIVCTMREGEAKAGVGDALADLTTAPGVSRIHLGALTPEDCARLLERLAPAIPEEYVPIVVRAAEGNPLFLSELARDLVERRLAQVDLDWDAMSGHLISVPESICALVDRRVKRLADATRMTLSAAAVIGRDFELPLLLRVVEMEGTETLAALGPAIDAGILQRTTSPSRFRFSHALVREAITDALSSVDRVGLHLRVGRAIEQLYASAPAQHLASLAHHFYEAAIGGAAEEAVDYGRRAGEHAYRVGGFHEARRLFEKALSALDLVADPQSAERCELMVGLGQAEFLTGDVAAAKERLAAAAQIARQLDNPELYARAVLGFAGVYGVAGASDPGIVTMLEQALDGLGQQHGRLRVELMGRLGTELYWTPQRARCDAIGEDMVALARTEETATLTRALNSGHYVLWRADNVEQRLGMADENVALAESLGDRFMAASGRVWRVIDLTELGRFREAAVEIDAYQDTVMRAGSPFLLWQAHVMEAMRMLVEGRLEEAEETSRWAHEIATRGQMGPNADIFFAVQTLQILWHQGRLAELEEGARLFAAQYAAIPAWSSALALIYGQLGKGDEGAAEVRGFVSRLDSVPRDTNFLAAVSLMGEAAAMLGLDDVADAIIRELEPFRDRFVVVGNAASCFGSVSYFLGRALALAGRADDAAVRLRAALAAHEAIRAPVLAAHAQFALAEVLAKDPTATVDVGRLLAAAATTADDHGMSALTKQIEELRQPSSGVVSRPVTATSGPERWLMRLDGEYWAIGRESAAVRLRSSKGMRYIAHLVARPGVDVFAADLAQVVDGAPAASVRPAASNDLSTSADLGDAGDVLDEAAKRAYRARLEDLRDELAEAEQNNDIGRAEAARAEMEALARQLSSAVGLGGRDRKQGSHAERARLNVGRAIRTAINNISKMDAAVGRYLADSIRTGTYCAYTPDPGRPVEWVLGG